MITGSISSEDIEAVVMQPIQSKKKQDLIPNFQASPEGLQEKKAPDNKCVSQNKGVPGNKGMCKICCQLWCGVQMQV